MNLIINDVACNASVGQTLGNAAWKNHSHLGAVCGGRGVCQTCYVTVLEGAECLSPMTEVEQAFLSPRQKQSGGRLACQTRIEKDGAIRLLSRPTEVQRLVLNDWAGFMAFNATMIQDSASQIASGMQNLVGRILKGEVHPIDGSDA